MRDLRGWTAKALYMIVYFAVVSSGEIVWALDPLKPVSQYSHALWRSEDGLPHNFIQAILQTRDGYLWLGTLEGLVRFDGAQFTVFDTQNTRALRHNSVVALCEDRHGALWIGTSGGGIACYKAGAFTATYTTANGLPNNYIRAIYEDRAGGIWITAHDGGLVRFENGRFHVFTSADGLPENSMRTVLEDSRGRLWAGANEAGLAVLEGQRFRRLGPDSGLRSGQVRVIYEDRRGRLWVGTRGGGLHLWQDGSFRVFTTQHGLPNNTIRAILEDRAGNLWVGTEGGGLARFNGGVFATFNTRDGLPHGFVRSLFEDREGNLWVGTRGGLSRLRDKDVATWTTAEGLINDTVRTVMEDSSGRMWIGASTGLNVIQNERIRTIPLSRDGLRDHVRALARGDAGVVWIGADSGLYLYRDGAISRIPLPDAFSTRSVRSIRQDSRGRLWVGTYGGLLLRQGGVWTAFTPASGLPLQSVAAIAEDRSGGIWFGGAGGLARWRDGRFEGFTPSDGLAHNVVTCVHFDAENTLWAGTRGGLSRYRNGKFHSFTRRDGLLSDNILHIVEDHQRRLWLSTPRGVSRVEIRELEDFASGRVAALNPVTFDTSDGMKSAECSGDSSPGGCRARNGRIWFATAHGAVVFDPLQVRVKLPPPPVLVERVSAGARSILSVVDAVSLPVGEGNLEIQFTAIALGAPEGVRFRYRLDGVDAGWIDAGRRRSAYYANLPPGEYRFRVQAASNERIWPREETVLAIQLRPRFYQTAWFYGLCLLALGGAAAAAYRLHVRGIHSRYEAVLAERMRIGREIHDTLMQGVTGISLQLEAASKRLLSSPAQAKQEIDRALSQMDETLAEARRCVLELRSGGERQLDFGAAIRRLVEDLTSGHPIQAKVTFEGTPKRVAPEVQAQLLRVLREAVTNTLVHSRAQNLWVTLRFENGSVRLRVADDGRGFDIHAPNNLHFGIIGMRERVEQLGGHLEVRSAPGEGAEVSVAAPLHV